MEFYHQPIMLKQIIEGLNLSPSSVFVDCTLGGGGHSFEIIKKIPQGLLIGVDKDQDALDYCNKKFGNLPNKRFVKSDFKDFENILNQLEIDKVDGVLIDLGVSSHQIDTAERGFSFRFDGPLDMRMDKSQEKSAFHVVNFYPKEKLIKILYEYGEERFAPQIVNAIVKYRKTKLIETTFELKQIIEGCLPKKIVYKSGGASKKTFQAIRIEVNTELEGLSELLEQVISRLKKGGRLAVLTFHSLEDRIVKNVFKLCSTDCICPPQTPICVCGHRATVKLITKRPVLASEQEIQENPRSTSAKLRIIEKITD